MKTGVFPEGFAWGAATSACQIEGHTDADGGRSVWDAFCEEPGRIVNDDTCAFAYDNYNRWCEDVALLGDLGVGAYRFSISLAARDAERDRRGQREGRRVLFEAR